MKTINKSNLLIGVIFLLGLLATNPASAKDFIHKHSQNSKDIQAFINRLQPELHNIHSGLSHGVDFHVWATNDKTGATYSMECISTSGNYVEDFAALLAKGKTVFIGFNMDSPSCMWVLTAD